MAQKYLNQKQVRQYYGGVPKSTFYGWLANGKFPKPIKIGGTNFWSIRALEAFNEAQEN